MENKSSITALMSAFVRAYHNETEENPVFRDSIAKRLFTDEEYNQMKNYIISGADFFFPSLDKKSAEPEKILKAVVNTQLAPTPVARAEYCRKRLETEILTGAEQYVILGAGYDTSAFINSGLMHKPEIFELDRPLTQQDKLKRLSRAEIKIPDNLHFIPCDFSVDSLKEKLIDNGFDVTKKTFFSWLGVSYYLTDDEIRKMFSEISSFVSEGSTIVFDYADSGLFSSEIKRVKNMLLMANAGGEPMKFCCDEIYLAKLLEDYNFLIYESLTPDEIDYQILNYSDLTAFENIHYATATIKNTGHINTKEKILQTSLRLFARRGFDSVSVRDIAGELGITQSALYKHYKNKQDIFNSIIQRMEQNDSDKSKKCGVPENKEHYSEINPESFKKFSLEMFRYWTQDSFAVSFRRMITVEQYRNSEMSKLYSQYLSAEPLRYTADLFREMNISDPESKALEFYSPILMLINMYDSADDKSEIYRILKNHIENFNFE